MDGQSSPGDRSPATADAGNTLTHQGFKITTRKLPILKAEPIEQMTANLGITPPEMIFGENMTSIECAEAGWSINFNSFDALDRVDKIGVSMLQVAHSKEWQSTRWNSSKIKSAPSQVLNIRQATKTSRDYRGCQALRLVIHDGLQRYPRVSDL